MDDCPAYQRQAMLLPVLPPSPVYRGSPRVEEALRLLEENDYETLRKQQSNLIRGVLTWARVSAVAIEGIAARLVEGDLDRALDACDDAHTLADRLRQRDQHVNARVTAQVRERIGQLEALATCIDTAAALKEGESVDDLDALGRLLALHRRWHGMRRAVDSHADAEWLVALVQAAAGRVLTSGASGAAKGIASRAVAAWVPEVSPSASPLPNASPPPPSGTPPPAKRMRTESGGGGESLTWDDDDDELLR